MAPRRSPPAMTWMRVADIQADCAFEVGRELATYRSALLSPRRGARGRAPRRVEMPCSIAGSLFFCKVLPAMTDRKGTKRRATDQSPPLVRKHRLRRRLLLRPHRHVMDTVLQLDDEGRGLDVLALLVKLHAPVAHDKLLWFE